METKRLFTSEDLTIDKWYGNGQCTCSKCKELSWTDWFFGLNGKCFCYKCLKLELEEHTISIHATTENNKILYADRHLKILELQREERQDLKNIIKGQNEELKLAEFYEKFIKGGKL